MATHYLRVAFNVNGGHVQNESSNGAAASNFYYAAGLTSWTSYTASTSYKYFKGTGTITGCATSGGTYATHYQRIASTNSYPNLVNVDTFNIVRNGYRIVNTSAYRTTATGGTVLNEDYSSSSTTNPATYAKLGGSTSANKTVTIYVNWTPNEYSVKFNSNGGTGTMSTETGFKYGTAKALTSNGFTKTGYTFNGWSTTPDGEGRWEQVWSSASASSYSVPSTALRIHNQTLYAYYDSAWHKWDGDDFVSATAPATYINGGSSYTSCTPTPTTSASDGFSYISVAGKTYCLSVWENQTSYDERLYLYRWNPGQSFSNGASITTLQSCPTNGDTITLYAQWTPNTTNIMFISAKEDTSNLPSSTTATYNTTFTVPSTVPTVTGYTFLGWAIGYGGSQQVAMSMSDNRAEQEIIDAHPSQSQTWDIPAPYCAFCAVWGKTIIFRSGNPATSATAALHIDNTITTPALETISGWTALGWRDDSTASTSEYAANSTIEYTGTATTLYGVYSRTLTQSYNANGGSGTAPAAKTATQYHNAYGGVSTATFAAQSNTFTAPAGGWSFYTWSTATTYGSGTSYDSTASPTWNPSVTGTSSRTLYVIWKRSVTFYYGLSKSNVAQTQYRGGSSYTSLSTPGLADVSGWTALGWREDSTATTSTYEIIQSTSFAYTGSSLSLYAVYSRVLTQSYNANGGSGTAPAAKTATQYYNALGNISTVTFAAQANTFTAPTDTNGWSFFIWSTSSSPTSGTTYSETASPTWAPAVSSTTTSRTLYVRWHRILDFYSGISKAKVSTAGQYRGDSTYTTVTLPTPAALSTSGTPWDTLGWRTDTTAATNQYSSGSQSYTGVSINFYAVYERMVQISFSANGGTGTEPEPIGGWQRYNSNGSLSSISLTLPANTFTRPGYIFAGWEAGNPGTTITVIPALNDYTFINSNALWTPRVYIKQGGTWEESVPQIKVSGTWKTPTAMYVKVNGTWKQIY